MDCKTALLALTRMRLQKPTPSDECTLSRLLPALDAKSCAFVFWVLFWVMDMMAPMLIHSNWVVVPCVAHVKLHREMMRCTDVVERVHADPVGPF